MAELLFARLVVRVGKVVDGLLVRQEIEQTQELAVDAARGSQTDRQERTGVMLGVRAAILPDLFSRWATSAGLHVQL